MLLTVLGCSGSAPGPNAATSGYLLEADGFALGLDLGTGTLAVLQALRDPFDLDALLFSHLHPDHCADFTGLTVLRRYHPAPTRDPRANRLPVYGPGETERRLVASHSPDAATEAETDLSDVYEFHKITTETVHIGPFEVTALLAAHPCEAYSFRISGGGRTLMFTGDTGIFDGLADLAAGADVLLSEASWTHAAGRPVNLHLSGTDAGTVARRAAVGRLLVTHVPPWTDAAAVLAEARSAYQGETVLVRQGQSYPI
ncbi:MBL fold metallo-hydrolase [Actinophytocola sp.]|uniref:MBL fold metallo-hydrolase n=1 Tax=Actinophytocola sp. TaxID=1872138 RepID=UPI002D7E87DF|nr:MBL fold metallo-hydrolase [Actinophytocola sp.]HET9138110.1 MBL fold metallo-hydrolase [Actinophytocola sp.]